MSDDNKVYCNPCSGVKGYAVYHDPVNSPHMQNHVINSYREEPVKATNPLDMMHESARDTSEGLIRKIAQMIRYKTHDYPTVHSILEVEINGVRCYVLFSGCVLPNERIDEYGKTFADDVAATALKVKEQS